MTRSSLLILIVQTAAAWYGAGFIWTMQILNYPLLSRIAASSFSEYESAHNRRFALVVAPAVLAVLATTVLLLVERPRGVPPWFPVAAGALIAVILVSTVLWQAPAHGRLARGFDAAVHARLVATNWIRTAAWTLLALVDSWILYRLTLSRVLTGP
jgi:hypothetical protein